MRLLAAAFLLFPAALLFGQTPTITSVSGEGGGPRLCPGGVAFVNGSNLGGTSAVVTVAGKRAYVFNGNATFLQLELPVDAALGATSLTVGSSAPFSVSLVQYAPGVATDGQADALVVGFHTSTQASLSNANPAAPGESVAIAVTGLGATNPAYATGTAPTNGDFSAVTLVKPIVTVGGKAATVTGSFLQPNNPGFYLVVFTVPAVTTGSQQITLTIGGQSTGGANLPVSTLPIAAAVTNAASYNDPALPNGPIAQGSIFVIKGNNLGPATLAIAQSAFQSATLNGTSVNVTVGGTTVAALMYYTSVTQVAALLPSNTPVGTGTITVTYNQQVGPARPITVVASNVGIFTVTSDGAGAGIVTNPDYSLVSNTQAANCGGPNTTCGAANPGDALIVWATGLGPVNGSDASGAGLGVNMTSVPLTIWLGGVQVPAIYQGRSGCCVGEDQIVFTVPANAPTGCAVPLTLQVNAFMSNTVMLPIAATGTRTCTTANPSFPASIVAQFATGKGPFSFGSLNINRNDNFPDGLSDDFNALFARFAPVASAQPFFMSYIDDAPRGTCHVFNSLNGATQPLTLLAGLDAGPQATVTGANGTKVVPGSGGSYQAELSANGTYYASGATTVAFPGGADIPAFNTTITPPAFPTMTSPKADASSPTAVTKANGLTVTWTGGSANVYVEIDGSSSTDQTGSAGASFSCTVPSTAGTFTIPASVMLAMPSGNLGGIYFAPTYPLTNFTPQGVNVGFGSVQVNAFARLDLK